MSDYETSDEDVPFTTHLYEPKYTDAELCQMELEQAERGERQRSKLKLVLQLKL